MTLGWLYEFPTTTNPNSTVVFNNGQPAVDVSDPTAPLLKIGDGVTAFNSLPYVTLSTSGGVISSDSSKSAYIIQRSIEGVVYETSMMYWVAPASCNVTAVSMSLSSNPSATGSYCKVQIMKNSTLETSSIFTTDIPVQITELTSTTNGIYTQFATLDSSMTSFATGDVMHFRVNQADTGSADLLVQVCLDMPDSTTINGGTA